MKETEEQMLLSLLDMPAERTWDIILRTGISPQTVYKNSRHLNELGLIKRVKSGQIITLELTEKGKLLASGIRNKEDLESIYARKADNEQSEVLSQVG